MSANFHTPEGVGYLAGPMTGEVDHGFPVFDSVAHAMRSGGLHCISPAELSREMFGENATDDFAHQDSDRGRAIMKEDFAAVVQADYLVMIPGWERSRGATEERLIAETMGKPIWLAIPGEELEIPTDWVLVIDPDQRRCPHVSFEKYPKTPEDDTLHPEVGIDFGAVMQVTDREHFEQMLTGLASSWTETIAALNDPNRHEEAVAKLERGEHEGPLTRTFSSGATRDTDERKHDYEGFLSIPALRAYGRYMQQHAIDPDGNPRASDNWQKGVPYDALMKSLLRHVFDLWELHRTGRAKDFDNQPVTHEQALCAILFNTFAYLHNLIVGAEDWLE